MARLPGDPLAKQPDETRRENAEQQNAEQQNAEQQIERTPQSVSPPEKITQSGSQSLSHAMPSQSVTVPLRALSAGRRWRDTARWIGLGMFLIGALLLAFVFYKAITGLNSFAQPDYLSMQFNRVAGDDIPARVQAAVVVFGKEFLSVLYLLLTGYLASAIASKGIQFFAASEAVIDEAVEAGIEE